MNLRVCVLRLGVQSSRFRLCCEVSLKQTLWGHKAVSKPSCRATCCYGPIVAASEAVKLPI